MRRTRTAPLVPLAVALALAGSSLVAGSVGASAAPAAPAAAAAAPAAAASAPAATRKVRTRFGLVAVGVGTRVLGGDVPAESTQTGAQVLSCTNQAGIDKRNGVATLNLPGFGTARGVNSRTWTTKRGNVVSSYAEHSVARVTLADTPLGTLDINGVSSLSRTWHDGKRFRASTNAKIASITFTPSGGSPVGLTIPTVGRPLTIPGLARISLGVPRTQQRANGASAEISAINIAVIPTNTRVVVAQTKSKINAGIREGIFGGSAVGLDGTVLEGLVELGKTPLVAMPCAGTNGNVRTERVAGVNLAGLLDIGGVEAGVFGRQGTKKRASEARGAARVAGIRLFGGRLNIEAVNASAVVRRLPGGRLTRSVSTGVVQITFDGETIDVIPPQGLNLAGLVNLRPRVVQNNPRGLSVTALQITLLDGTAATINLGKVALGIRAAQPRKKRG